MKVKMSVVHLLMVSVVSIFICGCGQPQQDSLSSNPENGCFLELAETDPTCPAVLSLGQKLNILAAYEIPSDSHMFIWARPFTNGQRTPGYSAHHLIPINGAHQKQGIAEMWFFFEGPTVVDEVQIYLKAVDSQDIIKTISVPVDAAWQ